MTIIKRETETMDRIHVCDVYAAPCDDPESQLDLSITWRMSLVGVKTSALSRRDWIFHDS
jgi:hypothetical protein